jgi:formamidopyrimidine-DNA glycosylase
MPELPDLEVIREVLSRHLVGERIERVDVRRPIVWPGCP